MSDAMSRRAHREAVRQGLIEPPQHVHGTENGYNYWRCRCERCRAAHRTADRRRREGRPVPPGVHGTANGYSNWRCRCPDCRRAWAERQRAYMRRRPDQMLKSRERERRRHSA